MAGIRPSAGATGTSQAAPPSLEDRLRGMIISHQHHQQPRRQTPLEIDPYAQVQGVSLQQQSHYPRSDVPQFDASLPLPNVFSAAPPLPVPFPQTPLLRPVAGRAALQPQSITGQSFAGPHEDSTPRSVPKHLPVNRNSHPPSPVHFYGPGSRYPARQNMPRPSAPPTANLDHFPPLGKEIPKGKSQPLNSVLPQHADQHNGQQYQRRPHPPAHHYEQFFAEQASHLDQLAHQLLDKITPPESEVASKRALLETLERICKQLIPTAKLLPFGSLVTGFATASSDIDCLFSPGIETNDGAEEPEDYPSLLEGKLQDEGFDVKLLSRTRVPIIKMVQRVAPGCPQEMQCDIGFTNRLAIHNTQLLLSYSRCDPRLKEMVLFVKWWAKRRHINSPYRGTLSSYGYVLMILHYLLNIVSPPVLPNLQLQPVPENTDDCEVFHIEACQEYNIWFSRNPQGILPSTNNNSLGELLRGFFDYYAYKFAWGQAVISIRTKGGLLTKQEKGWIAAKSRIGATADGTETWEVKDRYLFALEDPFETTHNVGRTCNGPGVGRIRDELRRAQMFIKIRGDRGKELREHLCEEAPPERTFMKKEERDQKDPNSPENLAQQANSKENTVDSTIA